MKITSKYRKFKRAVLKDYPESEVYKYYKAEEAKEGFETLTVFDLVYDFTMVHMPRIYSERLDKLSLEQIVAPVASQ